MDIRNYFAKSKEKATTAEPLQKSQTMKESPMKGLPIKSSPVKGSPVKKAKTQPKNQPKTPVKKQAKTPSKSPSKSSVKNAKVPEVDDKSEVKESPRKKSPMKQPKEEEPKETKEVKSVRSSPRKRSPSPKKRPVTEPMEDEDDSPVQKRPRRRLKALGTQEDSPVRKSSPVKLRSAKEDVKMESEGELDLNDADLGNILQSQVSAVSRPSKKRKFSQLAKDDVTDGPSPVKKTKDNIGEAKPKKKLFQQRQSQTSQDLALEEGISKGLKAVKLDYQGGVGSRRVLPEEKIDPKPTRPSRSIASITKAATVQGDKKQTKEVEKPAAKPVPPPTSSGKKTEDDIPKDAFSNLTFVVTGIFENITREKLEQLIVAKGGRKTSAISGKTSYLVAGHKLEDGREVNESSKYRNAVSKKVEILTEEGFEKLVAKLCNFTGFTFAADPEEFANQFEDAKEEVEEAPKQMGERQTEMWTDLHKPGSIKDLVGNQGVIKELFEWLRDWDTVHIKGIKKDVPAPRGFGRNAFANVPKVNAKAALISGPPGIGKTSSVRIICKSLGFEVLEKNASDCRNKSAIQGAISTLSGNKSIDYFTVAGQKTQQANALNENILAFGGQNYQKSVIIMDEVDGVGAGDRGGVAALISVIKDSRSPIICICNDRQSTKIQSLANHCYDLKFQKPNENAILQRALYICRKEGLQVDEAKIKQMIAASGQDIRQLVNMLQMWKNNSSAVERGLMGKDESVMINNFEAAYRLLNCKANAAKYPTFRKKLDLFFIDHEFVPLLVQECYLNCFNRDQQDFSAEDINTLAEAADMISVGDLCNVQIRKEQNWSLLPNYGTLSSVAPCLMANGQSNYPYFPAWLGKNSSARKAARLLRELKQKMGDTIMADKFSIQHEVIPYILFEVVSSLKKGDTAATIEFLDEMNITNDMMKEHVLGLALSKQFAAQLDKVDTKTKAAFTREYNKTHGDFKRVGKQTKGEKPVSTDEPMEDQESSESEEEVLMDEEQMKEIKAAKLRDKAERKAAAAMRRLEKGQQLEMVQVAKKEDTKKTAKAADTKGAKPKGKGKSKK